MLWCVYLMRTIWYVDSDKYNTKPPLHIYITNSKTGLTETECQRVCWRTFKIYWTEKLQEHFHIMHGIVTPLTVYCFAIGSMLLFCIYKIKRMGIFTEASIWSLLHSNF